MVPAVRRRPVGRERELGVIGQCLDGLDAATRSEGARFIEITGEPGIGKSLLVHELATQAAERGQLVGPGRATEFERGVPFGLVVEALDDHLAALDPHELQRLCGDWVGLLAEVFPALQGWRRAAGAQVMEVERYRLHRAVRALIEALAQPPGLVVLLDDVHWADPGSVELLVHLLRHPPRAPVLIVVSYRVNRVPVALEAALADAACHEHVQRLELGPLTVEASAKLLGRTVAQCRMLHECSGGNPFYLQLLACGSPDALTEADHRGIGDLDAVVPAYLRSALLAELDAVSPAARLVALAAAVAGDPFEPELVSVAAGMGTAETSEALDDLIARDLVRAAEGRQRFRFRHPLVRHLIYTSAAAGWRACAHERLAAFLHRRGEPLVARAHHVARAARPGDEEAIALLLDAAEATLPSSPATAAEWLSAALHLLPAGEPATARKVSLLLRLAKALNLSGQLQASRDSLAEVASLVPAEARGLRARVITAQATLERLLGRYPQARALLRGELESVAQLGAPEVGQLLFELAGSARLHGDFTEAYRWATRAVTATRDHDPALYPAALSLLARASASEGDSRRATALLAEAGTLLDALPDAALVARLETAAWVGWGELLFDRYGAAARHFERGLTLARRTRQNHVAIRLLVGQATVHGSVGRLTEATEMAATAADAAAVMASSELLAGAMAMRCWFATWTGDIDSARRAGRQAVEAARTVTGTVLVFAEGMLAHLHLVEGDPVRCVSGMLRAGGGADLPAVYPLLRATCYEVLVRAELAQGHRARALEWAQRAEKVAARVGVAGQIGVAAMACAGVLLDTDAVTGVERARDAAVVFTGLGDPLRAGRARLLAGRALVKAAMPGEAAAELDAARVLFAEVGAPGLYADAVRRLRRLGGGVPAPRDGTDRVAARRDLSAREREVAGLVARGYSNRQIAEELVLSVRTVTTHVSHIFAKLGVSSRAAIAAEWVHALHAT